MHVLEYLSDPDCEKKPEDSIQVEYRLLSSGTLYLQCFGDWSKSEIARMLLSRPLLLFVTSRPFEDYPLELTLRLKVPHVEEVARHGSGEFIRSYHPDDEVVGDLAALLSVLCRRLITVAGKTGEQRANRCDPVFGEYMPMPLATSLRRIYWRPHPITLEISLGRTKPRDYNPHPKAVNGQRLTRLLFGLPRLKHAESLVSASRLYALALELIHDRPDIAYQLLISSAETIANAVLRDFQPSVEKRWSTRKPFTDGLSITGWMRMQPERW